MDKTINKTQHSIRQALLTLMSTTNFNDISIKAICEQANVSRSTFYFYYESKYVLLESIEYELINGFIDIMLELRKEGPEKYYTSISNGHCKYFVDYFKYIKEHYNQFMILFKPDTTIGFPSRFSRAIAKTRIQTVMIWNEYQNAEIITKNDTWKYREEILSSIYVSLFTTWVNRNMDLSEEKMGKMLLNLWIPLVDFQI